jgi:hypothetical protein
MPFTFSHPAAVLPFAFLPARWISMTGLVIGSTAPDFEYFFRMNIRSVYSHTWPGVFWFDLPLTILLAFVFHSILRDRLIENLPPFLAKRLIVFRNFSWTKHFKENFIVVIISMLIGISSHLLWDGFTHETGMFVQQIGALKNVFIIAGYELPLYNILQHASTLVGGIIILYALMKLPADENYKPARSIFPFWFFASAIALLILTIRFLTGLKMDDYGNMLITAISGGLAGLMIMAGLFSRKRKTVN